MTWGVQNTEAQAHEQLDYAVKERGVNFIVRTPPVKPNWTHNKPPTCRTV
jgi:hypothetical protein